MTQGLGMLIFHKPLLKSLILILAAFFVSSLIGGEKNDNISSQAGKAARHTPGF